MINIHNILKLWMIMWYPSNSYVWLFKIQCDHCSQNLMVASNFFFLKDIIHDQSFFLKIYTIDDLEKFYDRMDWDFVKDTIYDVGTPFNFVSLIWHCFLLLAWEWFKWGSTWWIMYFFKCLTRWSNVFVSLNLLHDCRSFSILLILQSMKIFTRQFNLLEGY